MSLGLGDKQNDFPAARWRQGWKIAASVATALLVLGTSVHLVRVRTHQLAQQNAHATVQQAIDDSDVVGHYRATDDTFAILRTPREPQSPVTMREAELRDMIGAAAPAKRKVFIIYDPAAFPRAVDRETLEHRVRSVLQSAGATVSFLAAS